MALPGLARAQDALVAQSTQCTEAVAAAETRYGIPTGLLLAIAKSESGRPIPPLRGLQPWPWAIDADGRAFYFDSKAAAVAYARQSGAAQVDVGCAQINLQSHPRAFRDMDTAFDPAANADYGGRYLRQLYDETGNWFTAVGYYHSHTPELAAAYRDRVSAVAEGRDIPAGLIQPLYLRAIRQGTLHLSLVGGGVLRINLNRQPRAPGHRRATTCEVIAALGPYMRAPAATRGCGRQ